MYEIIGIVLCIFVKKKNCPRIRLDREARLENSSIYTRICTESEIGKFFILRTKSVAFARHIVISMPVSITEPACVYLSGSGQPMEEPVRRRPSCAAPLSSWESRGGDVRLAVYADCRAVTDSMPRGFPRASCLTYTLYAL